MSMNHMNKFSSETVQKHTAQKNLLRSKTARVIESRITDKQEAAQK